MQIIKFRTSNFSKEQFIEFINNNKIINIDDTTIYLISVNEEFAIYTTISNYLVTYHDCNSDTYKFSIS